MVGLNKPVPLDKLGVQMPPESGVPDKVSNKSTEMLVHTNIQISICSCIGQ